MSWREHWRKGELDATKGVTEGLHFLEPCHPCFLELCFKFIHEDAGDLANVAQVDEKKVACRKIRKDFGPHILDASRDNSNPGLILWSYQRLKQLWIRLSKCTVMGGP